MSSKNAMRSAALARKNWPLMGEAEAGDHTAVSLTIIGNARRWRLDPFEYLRELMNWSPTVTNRQMKDMMLAALAGGPR
ncbi:hypothetical protein [Verrucomicrobium sp. BvORR106]|uniref:hypothetical protein n=1 Tax=Verrucomicrobium sp. BvORR106 TaxID=1403819 RepID=UPI00056E0071|nr:hypothetical protein [Verrucomicrobium sp. BvORR106]